MIFRIQKSAMSGKGGSGGKSVSSSGTNGQGNTYTNYSDGGYRLVTLFNFY